MVLGECIEFSVLIVEDEKIWPRFRETAWTMKAFRCASLIPALPQAG